MSSVTWIPQGLDPLPHELLRESFDGSTSISTLRVEQRDIENRCNAFSSGDDTRNFDTVY